MYSGGGIKTKDEPGKLIVSVVASVSTQLMEKRYWAWTCL